MADRRITAQGYRLHNEGTLVHYSCYSGKQYAYKDTCAIPHYAELHTPFFNRRLTQHHYWERKSQNTP